MPFWALAVFTFFHWAFRKPVALCEDTLIQSSAPPSCLELLGLLTKPCTSADKELLAWGSEANLPKETNELIIHLITGGTRQPHKVHHRCWECSHRQLKHERDRWPSRRPSALANSRGVVSHCRKPNGIRPYLKPARLRSSAIASQAGNSKLNPRSNR